MSKLPSDHINSRSLTTREREILKLLAGGLTNRSIASQLHLSEKTIRNRVSEIMSKLNVQSRTQAAIWALENGLVPDSNY